MCRQICKERTARKERPVTPPRTVTLGALCAVDAHTQGIRNSLQRAAEVMSGGRPHCIICGDTKEQTPLRKVKRVGLLCTDCIGIQRSMPCR